MRSYSRHHAPPTRPAVIAAVCALALVGALLTACNTRTSAPDRLPTRTYQGQERSFLLGLSSLPMTMSEEAYRRAFQIAGQSGEVILIQRPPAWEDFREGSTVSDETARTTQAEKMLAEELGLRFFVSIDLLEAANRDEIALPAEWAGRSISDPEVRAAYLAYAEYMALNYKPAYMALAVEANLLYEQDRVEFEQFLEVYREAYSKVKQASPATQVFVTFQYEELLGLIPWKKGHAPRWELARLFEPQLDAFAFSSYPSFVYPRADDIPGEYYTQARHQTALPIVFAETGYASAPGPNGVNSGTEGDQARYVRRLLTDAEAMQAALLIWFAGADPTFADQPPYDLFHSIGLRRSDGTPKLALQYWQEAVGRPPAGPSDGVE